MCATSLLRHLRHPIPPPPQEPQPRRNICTTGVHDSNVPGAVTVLEQTSFPPLSSVLEKIQFVEKSSSRSECRVDTPLTAASLTPGPLKHGKEVDLNTCPCPQLHISLARAHASVLQVTVKQHVIHLTGELVSHRHRSTFTSLGGLRYAVMFVDSALRLQRPYDAREKSAAAIFSVVKHFKADMGIPRAFRTDNGTEYLNSMLVDFCNDLGIRREFTAPYTPQQNRLIESAISQAFMAGHAARLGVPQLYLDIRLQEVRGCIDAAGMSL